MDLSDVRIDGETMSHANGVWAGMRPNWWTATHLPTGVSVTWSDCCVAQQYRARSAALACLEMLIDDLGSEDVPRQVCEAKYKLQGGESK